MITGVNHLTLAVADLERAFDFYVDVLGCQPVARWSNGAYLTAGDTWLALVLDPSTQPLERGTYSHIAFSCPRQDFGALVEALRAAGCRAWSDNVTEGDSFYFQDSDGHQLEIHVGDLASRLAAMKQDPWDSFTFYED
ncbi:MAG: VOC family protein [Pseudomonadota bacterium]